MRENAKLFQHRGIEIVATPTPTYVSDWTGFGWMYQPKSPTDNLTIFVVVIKCNHAPYNDEQPNTLLQLGYGIVQNRLDNNDYVVGGYYCYAWGEREGAVEMDCSDKTSASIKFTEHPLSE
jgi:hypothetical protein